MAVVTLDGKRRLTVPSRLAAIAPGDHFEVRFDAEEESLVFRRLPQQEDWLEVLKACPASMEGVPARRRAYARRRLS